MKTPFFPALRPVLAPMGSRSKTTVRSLAQATLFQIEQNLGPALRPDLLDKPASGDHCRQRVFPLRRTFWCWLWQVLQGQTSCREVVRQIQALVGLLDQDPIQAGSGAYCEARRKLPLPLLEQALTQSFRSAEKQAPAARLLQGRPLKLVDGASVRLQDSTKNRADFPPAKNQFCRPSFPLLKMVVLYSLASGAILARAVGSLMVHELRLLLQLRGHLQPRDIVMGDRAYGVYVLSAVVQGLGADLLARFNARSRRVDFRRARKSLGPGDALFVWHKPANPSPLLAPEEWAALPAQLTVRIVRARVQRPGFRTRELSVVTTLLDRHLYPAQELLRAYCQRWRLEMCLDDLKTTLGMEMLSCKSPALVQKELLVFLIAHNLIRWIMNQAARGEEVDPERVSFKGTLDAFRQWTAALVQVRGPGKKAKQRRLWQELLKTLAADLVPERPGRHEPRAIKRRSKYPRLTKPRHTFVERWSRNKRRRVARAKNQSALN